MTQQDCLFVGRSALVLETFKNRSGLALHKVSILVTFGSENPSSGNKVSYLQVSHVINQIKHFIASPRFTLGLFGF